MSEQVQPTNTEVKSSPEVVVKAHQRVHVCCILDTSGSMRPFSKGTLTAVNTLIENQQKDQQKLTLEVGLGEEKPVMKFSACYFALDRQPFLSAVPIEDVKPIDKYECEGTTALTDAIAETIADLESKVEKDEKVLLYIFTDGQENASRKHKTEDVRKLVKRKQEEGWEVTFLGANQDASEEGGKYSIPTTSCINFEQSHTGISEVFENINMHMSYSKRGVSSSISVGSKRSREDDDSWVKVLSHDITAADGRSSKKMRV